MQVGLIVLACVLFLVPLHATRLDPPLRLILTTAGLCFASSTCMAALFLTKLIPCLRVTVRSYEGFLAEVKGRAYGQVQMIGRHLGRQSFYARRSSADARASQSVLPSADARASLSVLPDAPLSVQMKQKRSLQGMPWQSPRMCPPTAQQQRASV